MKSSGFSGDFVVNGGDGIYLLPDNGHAVFYTVHTIRNLPEVIFAKRLLNQISVSVQARIKLIIVQG